MRIDKRRGISLLEVLISASLFTIVILGISQTVLLMHRYASANLCKNQAHLLATSYFESLLCDTHPYEFIDANDHKTIGNNITLLDITDPTQTITFKFDMDQKLTQNKAKNLNTFVLNVAGRSINVYIALYVQDSLAYDNAFNNIKREAINPPEGFQSLRLTYWWESPLMRQPDADAVKGSLEYLNCLPKNELYAIRPMQPDDPGA